VLLVPILMLVTTGPAAAATASTSAAVPVPTVPQNLREDHVDGVFQGIRWDPSTFDGRQVMYTVYLWAAREAPIFAPFSQTSMSLREFIDGQYMEPGGTYTFTVVAMGVSGGALRTSGHSNKLTVTFPHQLPW
jgi:hypothetical protein